MRRYTFAALLVAAGLVGLPAVSGCDDKDTTEKKVEITKPNGETTEHKVKIETDDDGDKKITEEKKVDGDTVDKKEVEVDVDEK